MGLNGKRGVQFLPPDLQHPVYGPGWLHPLELRRRRRQWAKCKDRDRWYDEVRAGMHGCAACGTQADYLDGVAYLVVDHVVPLARGGTNDDDNLQVLCEPCNGRKGARMPAELPTGWWAA